MIVNEPKKIPAEQLKKNWYYIISPCIIMGTIALLWTIYWFIIFEIKSGWSIMGIIFGLPFLVVMFLADLIVKFSVKENTAKIWIIEILIILACFVSLGLYTSE